MPFKGKARRDARVAPSLLPGEALSVLPGDSARVAVVWGEDSADDAWHDDSRIAPAEGLSDLPDTEFDAEAEDRAMGSSDARAEDEGDEEDEDQEIARVSRSEGARLVAAGLDRGLGGGRPSEDLTKEHGASASSSDGDTSGSPRTRSPRSKTIARKQMLRERKRMLTEGTLPQVLEYERPVTRAECRGGKRPCLYVSCRYHLYLDVNPQTGSLKINFPEKEIWELEETCALDVAERGGVTLEEVGEIMNLTRERIRQVEVSGLDKLRDGDEVLHTFVEGEDPPSRLRSPHGGTERR